jgi:hypothetical protein
LDLEFWIADSAQRNGETTMERYAIKETVSQYLRNLGFLWTVENAEEFQVIRVCKTREFCEFVCNALNVEESDFLSRQNQISFIAPENAY